MGWDGRVWAVAMLGGMAWCCCFCCRCCCRPRFVFVGRCWASSHLHWRVEEGKGRGGSRVMIPPIVSGKTELGGLECVFQPSTGWSDLPMTNHKPQINTIPGSSEEEASTNSARILQDGVVARGQRAKAALGNNAWIQLPAALTRVLLTETAWMGRCRFLQRSGRSRQERDSCAHPGLGTKTKPHQTRPEQFNQPRRLRLSLLSHVTFPPGRFEQRPDQRERERQGVK